MLKMCRELGFEIKTDPDDRGLRDVTLHTRKPLGSERYRPRMTGNLLIFLRGREPSLGLSMGPDQG